MYFMVVNWFNKLAVLFTMLAAGRSVPSIPPPVDARALALQQTVSAAVLHGASQLTIPAGVFVFSNTTFAIEHAEDLIIDAYNVTLVFYFGSGLLLSNCNNVTLRGLILDSSPPNFAQGLILPRALSMPNSMVAHFDTAVFIPPDTTVAPFNKPGGHRGKWNAMVSFWDASTRLPIWGSLNFMNESKSLGENGSFAIGLAAPLSDQVLHRLNKGAGVLVTVFPRAELQVSSGGYAWQAFNSSSVVAEDVTIHGGGSMGFHEQLGAGGHVYRRVKIERKPTAGWNGLLSVNADGLHSTDVGTGPVLEDSEFGFTGDDYVNAHNRMGVVCAVLNHSDSGGNGGNGGSRGSHNGTSSGGSAQSQSLAVVDVSGGLGAVRAGDVLKFYGPTPVTRYNVDPIAPPFRGAAVVKAEPERVVGRDEHERTLLEACAQASTVMNRPPLSAGLVVSTASAPVWRVTFKSALPAAVTATATPYSLVNFEGRSGAGASLRRNYFHDAGGSGGRVLLKVPNSTYAGNVAAGGAGVYVQEQQEWLEGGLGIENVRLESNVIQGCAQALTGHVHVMQGLHNITCRNTTFIGENGSTALRNTGC